MKIRFHTPAMLSKSCRLAALQPTRVVHPARRMLCVRAAYDKTNVMVVGSGGREHSLVWKLAQSPLCSTLYCAPGSPGTATEPHVVNAAIDTADNRAVVEFCRSKGVEVVVVGPEAPLVAGLVDDLRAAGIRAFGPTAAAAQLEGSKVFMKDLCKKYNIPTAAYEKFTDADTAKAYIRTQGAPIVVKASGLAAGKGVIVALSVQEALDAVDAMLVDNAFGDAGAEVVVEEFLDGEEASFFALVDGEDVVALASAQDHKAAYDGDKGPNTGGMGAYSPAPVVTPEIEAEVMETIVKRTAQAMVSEGIPFQGVLFAGLMIKNGQVKLLEHNVRFGDPECQGLMMRLDSDLLHTLLSACDHKLSELELKWRPEAALTVVVAANGYPGSYKKGTVINNTEAVQGAKVFHAGTSTNAAGAVVSNGGRVLGVTALGKDVAEAQTAAYKAVSQIQWDDAFYRKDIGWRAIARLEQQQQQQQQPV